MSALRNIILLVLAATAASESLTGEPVTPVGKVIDLLENLVEDIEEEGKTEAGTYNTFACFCKTASNDKSKSIKSARDSIETESAGLEKKTAKRADDQTELQERKVKEEQYDADMAKEKARCAKEDAEFDSNSTDLGNAINGLTDAINAMETSKPVLLVQTLRKSLSTAAAQSVPVNSNVRSLLTKRHALLQQGAHSGVNPLDPEYQYHSGGIISALKDLQKDFRTTKSNLDDDWKAATKVCNTNKKDIQDLIDANDIEIGNLEKSITTLTGNIADHRKQLVEDEISLKDDELYMKDLTDRCEIRAKDWDQRSSQRAAELTALNGALDLMRNNVSGLDSAVNKRTIKLEDDAGDVPSIEDLHSAGLLQKNTPEASKVPTVKSSNATHKDGSRKPGVDTIPKGGAQPAISFLQDANVAHKTGSLLRGSAKVGVSMQARQQRALSMLRTEGARLQSTLLVTLGMRTAREMSKSGDPFTKVKKLIQELIERLLAEATAEATKKGFCDESLKMARTDRDFRYTEVNQLAAQYMTLDTKADELNAEIELLTDQLQTLTWNLGNATETFEDDKEEMETAISKAKEGLKAVTMAITILKDFYRKASRARDPKAALLQESPVSENAAQGAYRGNQDAAEGIIGMMQVIKSDFQRTISTTEESLSKTTVEFVKFDRASKADIGGKSTKRSLDIADLKKTLHKANQTKHDLQTNQNLLDDALKQLFKLKPVCIDSGMSYEARVQKREQEMQALRQALCLLDSDPSNEEEDCINNQPVQG